MTEEKIVKLPKRISLTNIVLLLREDIRGGKRFVTKDAFMYRAKKVDWERVVIPKTIEYLSELL